MHKKKHQFTLPKGTPYATGGITFGPFVQPYNNLIYSGVGGDIGSQDDYHGQPTHSLDIDPDYSNTSGIGEQNGSLGEGTDAGGAGSYGAGVAAL